MNELKNGIAGLRMSDYKKVLGCLSGKVSYTKMRKINLISGFLNVLPLAKV